MRESKQGTWRQALLSLFGSVLLLLTFRWVAFEPYVIPSGSMLPTLKVLDFIYVNKFAYGLRLPFSSTWLWERSGPARCDVAVFRSQTEPGVFLIKRVMGLPGEKVELLESGRLRIDGKILETAKISEDMSHTVYAESCASADRQHRIQLSKYSEDLQMDSTGADIDPVIYAIVVPENQFLMFGDNRHASADSRVWGALPREELLGQALGVWLSCENSLPGLPRVCDPSQLRWDRMFKNFDEIKP